MPLGARILYLRAIALYSRSGSTFTTSDLDELLSSELLRQDDISGPIPVIAEIDPLIAVLVERGLLTALPLGRYVPVPPAGCQESLDTGTVASPTPTPPPKPARRQTRSSPN